MKVELFDAVPASLECTPLGRVLRSLAIRLACGFELRLRHVGAVVPVLSVPGDAPEMHALLVADAHDFPLPRQSAKTTSRFFVSTEIKSPALNIR